MPAKLAAAMPSIMGAIGAILTILGTGYETAAAADPSVPGILGWPAGLTGVLTTIGAFMMAQNAKTKAEKEAPKPEPNDKGEAVPPTLHLVSLAVQSAVRNNEVALARRLVDSLGADQKENTVTPSPIVVPGKPLEQALTGANYPNSLVQA